MRQRGQVRVVGEGTDPDAVRQRKQVAAHEPVAQRVEDDGTDAGLVLGVEDVAGAMARSGGGRELRRHPPGLQGLEEAVEVCGRALSEHRAHRGTTVGKSREYGGTAMRCRLFTRWRSLIAPPPSR